MQNNATRVLLFIIGMLLIVLGCALFSTPLLNSLVVAYGVCISMVIYGIFEIAHYFFHRQFYAISAWTLADGIITVILGMMLMFMPDVNLLATSIFFTFWVMFTGITRTSAALVAKDLGITNWRWLLAVGLGGILFGILMLCYPLYNILAFGYLIPVAILIQGVSAISLACSTVNND